jgi:hypothetical protein
MNLCQYKDILGKPNEGIHRIRILDVAIVDVIFAVILGLLIANFLKVNKASGILVSFGLGVLVHKMFCVETKFSF